MKFLPLFLAPFVLARASNDSKAPSDDLEALFVETNKLIELQAEKVKLVENLIHSLDDTSKQRAKEVGKVAHLLHGAKKDDFKMRAKMVVKAEKSLLARKAEVESQTSKIAIAERKLNYRFKVEGESQPKKAVNAEKLLQSAKSELESQAEKVVKAEELIRGERDKVEKHVEDALGAEELLSDVKDEGKLESKKISEAQKFLRDLKKKGKSQAEDLAKMAPLLSAKADDKKAKKVEEAKQSLDEIKVELKADWPKAVSAEASTRGVMTGMELHIKKITDVIPLLEDIRYQGSKEPDVEEIEGLLRALEDKGKLVAKNIAKAEKLVKALAI